jgi:hypothetical protein
LKFAPLIKSSVISRSVKATPAAAGVVVNPFSYAPPDDTLMTASPAPRPCRP